MSTIQVQVQFKGPNPITMKPSKYKRLTVLNFIKLIYAMAHGSRQGLGSGGVNSTTANYIQFTDSIVSASSTATPAAVAVADTLTIAGTALTATKQRATGTVTFASAVAGNTITIAGLVFTAVNGAVTVGQPTFDISGGNTTGAASFASQLLAYGPAKGIVQATSAVAVATINATNIGTAGNAITLASSGGTLTVSGATLTGGLNASNNTFDPTGSNVQTGIGLANAINASTTAAVQQTYATVNTTTGVVTIIAKAGGVAGNAVTLTSSNGGRLAVTGAGFLAAGSQAAPTRYFF